MTFTQSVKGALLKGCKNLLPCCRTMFLSCLIRTIGSIEINSRGFGFSLVSENLSLLKACAGIIEKTFGTECRLEQENGVRLRNRNVYRLTADDSERVLFECGIVSLDDDRMRQIDEGLACGMTDQDCCKKTFIKAMFIGCGTINVGGGYHCEFAVGKDLLAQQLKETLESEGFSPKTAKRKGETLVYFKMGEDISDLLVYMGATAAALELQDIMVWRTVKNKANRERNCINANIGKVVEASSKQQEAINVIEKYVGLESLPPALKQAALLRRQYPYDSLDDLAASADGVSKSGLNHRFRKIIEIANELKEANNENK